MEVRAKKALGQHFLTDQSIAQRIVEALTAQGSGVAACEPAAGVTGDGGANVTCVGAAKAGSGVAKAGSGKTAVLEVGPGMGVLSQYLLEREDIDLKMIEIDSESVDYLLSHFPATNGRVIFGDFLKMDLGAVMGHEFKVIGNFPYNISSQIFFRILDNKDAIQEVVCMIQKEVAERIAEKPGTKTYGILSVLLQAWYDIEYIFTVGPGAFCPPPKVQSAVIRLRRNSRKELGCDEALFKTVVKTAFGQRRKTLRNSLKPLIAAKLMQQTADNAVAQVGAIAAGTAAPATVITATEKAAGTAANAVAQFTTEPLWDLRPERLSVEDFVSLTKLITALPVRSRGTV